MAEQDQGQLTSQLEGIARKYGIAVPAGEATAEVPAGQGQYPLSSALEEIGTKYGIQIPASPSVAQKAPEIVAVTAPQGPQPSGGEIPVAIAPTLPTAMATATPEQPTLEPVAPEKASFVDFPASPEAAPMPGETEKVVKTGGRFAAGVNAPVLTALHGYARMAEEGLALPYRVLSGDWQSRTPQVISQLTEKLKDVGAPEELVKDQGGVSRFISNLVGGVASYMIPGKIMGAFGLVPPAAATWGGRALQKFGQNLITFGATDVAHAVGAGGGEAEARDALIRSIPTAALFTVAGVIPFDKLTKNPWMVKSLESLATGTAFTGGALIGGEREPEALAVSFLTGVGLHLVTSGLPQRQAAPRQMTNAEYREFVNSWRTENRITEEEWSQVKPLLDKADSAREETSPEQVMSLFKTPEVEKPSPEARQEAIFGGPLGETIEKYANREDAIRALVPQIGDHARAEQFYDLYKAGDVDTALKEFPEHGAWATEQQKAVVPGPLTPGGYEVMARATEAPAPPQATVSPGELSTAGGPEPTSLVKEPPIKDFRKLVNKVNESGDPAAAKQLDDMLAANQEGLGNLFRMPEQERAGLEPIAKRLESLMSQVEETGDPNAARELHDLIAANQKVLSGVPRWEIGAAAEKAPVPPEPTRPEVPMEVAGTAVQDMATRPVEKPAPAIPPEALAVAPGEAPPAVATTTQVPPERSAEPQKPGGPEEILGQEPTPAPKAEPDVAKSAITAPEALVQETRGGKGSNPARAIERNDLAALVHASGGIDPKYIKDYVGTPEERQALGRTVLKKGGFAPDVIFDELKGLYPDQFGHLENAEDMMRYFLDGRYERNLNPAKMKEHYETEEEELDRERNRLGLSPEEFAEVKREAERAVQAEETPEGSGEGAGSAENPALTGDPFFDFRGEESGPVKYRLAEAAFGLKSPGKPARKFETRLREISTAYPDVDPEKAAQILRAQPKLPHHDIAFLSRLSQEEINQVIRGNLSASEREQLFKKATDLGQQKAFPGMGGGGGLFDRVAGEPAESRPLTTADIQKAFGPKATAVESTLLPGVHEVTLPNGRRILVRQLPEGVDIQVTPESLAAYGKQRLEPGEYIAGEWRSLNGTNMITLAKGAGALDLHHETFHGAMELVLTPREREAILKKYGGEEAAARAYEDWQPGQQPNTLFQKIKDFFQNIYRAFFPDAESVFSKVRSGEVWKRATAREGGEALYRIDRTPEEREADREARKTAGIPEYKDFKAELDKDGEALYQRMIAPGSREVPLYEGERYYGNRAGNMIMDENGKLVTLSKHQIWERLYDPQKTLLPPGEETPKDPRVAPEGTLEPPPNRTILRSFREKFSAAHLSEKAKLAHQSVVEHMGWAAREMEKSTTVLDKYLPLFDKMSQEELFNFTDLAETGQLAKLGPELQEAGQAWRRLSDGMHFLVADLKESAAEARASQGKKVPKADYEIAYWQDYFPRMFKNQEAAETFIRAYLKSHGRSLTGPEGFTKARSQLLFSEAVKAAAEHGLEPFDTNYVNMMKANIWEKLRFLTGQYIKNDLAEAGFLQRQRVPGWVEVKDKSLKGYYAHPDVARVLENHLSAGLRQDPIFKLYDKPATFLNEVMVGFSAFHATFESLADVSLGVGMNLSRAVGAALTGRLGTAAHYIKELAKAANVPGHVMEAGKLIKEYKQPGAHPEYRDLLDLMAQGGIRIHSKEFAQMGRSFAEAWRESKISLPRQGVQLFSGPIMNWLVPRIKISAIARQLQTELGRAREGLAPGEKLTKDAQVQIAQEVARNADNIFGQMVYDNLSMTRGLRDALRIFIGFPGWNLGSGTKFTQAMKGAGHLIGETGRAGAEALHGRKPAWEPMNRSERMSLEFYVGMVAVVAVAGAVTHRLLKGEWPGNAKDVFMPQTGGILPNGEPERMRLPSYMRDILSLSHPVEMVKHKLNWPLRMFTALAANQDYFGEQIRDPWASASTQAGQTAKYVVKSLLPFGIQGYMKTEEPTAKALNVIGITPVPREYTNTPAMNIIDEYNKLTRAATTTKEVAEAKKLKSDLLKMARDQDQIGFREAAGAAVSEGKLSRQQIKEIVKESQEPPGMSRFTKLPLEWALRVWDAASDQEKDNWRPYFLKKIMKEKPESLVNLREPVVSALEEMDLPQAAAAISQLTIPQGGQQFDLSSLGVPNRVPQIGGMGTVDAAINQAMAKNLQAMTKQTAAKQKRQNPLSVLGL